MSGMGPFSVVNFGKYQAVKKGDKIVITDKRGNINVINTKDFLKFMSEHLPNLSGQPKNDTFEMSGASSFAPHGGETSPITKYLMSVVCDHPENGGFAGKNPNKPLPWWVMEERPKTIDPKTGKLVYADTLKKPGACYMA